METGHFDFLERRIWRHLVFWMCWVCGFTFVKSVGQGWSEYLAWFAYYLLTLPLFMGHTYLVAYILLPRYMNRKKVALFVAYFLISFFAFSAVELAFSNELIFQWVGSIPAEEKPYLTWGNVMRSGLGNLYIVLIFIASKTIHDWSEFALRQKQLEQSELRLQMQESLIRVQPLMLIYAIDHIDRMVQAGEPRVSEAIALSSGLLNEVMIYHEEGTYWMAKEMEMVLRLRELVGIFHGQLPELEFYVSGDPNEMDLPPMILFSFVDLLYRSVEDPSQVPELHIELSSFAHMLSIQVLHPGASAMDGRLEACLQAMSLIELRYGREVKVVNESHPFGCTVVIKAASTEEREEHPEELATG